jgi:hypothetical protein
VMHENLFKNESNINVMKSCLKYESNVIKSGVKIDANVMKVSRPGWDRIHVCFGKV